MALLGVMLFHPETSSLWGGVAHMAVYFAVLAPLFWAAAWVMLAFNQSFLKRGRLEAVLGGEPK